MNVTIPKRRAGEKTSGAVMPIRFYNKVGTKSKEGKEELDEVEIPVKIDPNGGFERQNTTKETFDRIITFADAGERVISLRRDINVKLYSPMGMQGPSKLVNRLRYLLMTLGTTAKQQLSRAIRTAFEVTSKKQDATMTEEEHKERSMDEKRIFKWLGQPRHALWSGLDDETKQEAIKKANVTMEDYIWFQLNRLAYPELHAEALGKYDTYLRTNLVKPFAWTITQTLGRVEELFDMRHMYRHLVTTWKRRYMNSPEVGFVQVRSVKSSST